jgi:hypothetical protein
VIVSEDASLKTLAASRIARGANRIHSISFNPSAVSELDYLCYQCGFILRLFGTPAADSRWCRRGGGRVASRE